MVSYTLTRPISGVWSVGQDPRSGRQLAFGRQLASVSLTKIVPPVGV